MESSDDRKVISVTADAFDDSMRMESPCAHDETQVTFINGSVVMHCKDSFLNEGECEEAIAFRITHPAAIVLAHVARVDIEGPYCIGLKCAGCNENSTSMETIADLEVYYDKELDALHLVCAFCGNTVSKIPVASKEDIN